MYKTKNLIELLESKQFNIIAVIILIDSTIISLDINNDRDGMVALIESALAFSKKLDIDGEEDFNKFHGRRVHPKKLDPNGGLEVTFTLEPFYITQFKLV